MGPSPLITTSHKIISLGDHPTGSTLKRLSLVWAESAAILPPMLRIFSQGVNQHTISNCNKELMSFSLHHHYFQGIMDDYTNIRGDVAASNFEGN